MKDASMCMWSNHTLMMERKGESIQDPPLQRNREFLLEIPDSRHWNYSEKSQHRHSLLVPRCESWVRVLVLSECGMLLWREGSPAAPLHGYSSDIPTDAGIHPPLVHEYCQKGFLEVDSGCYPSFPVVSIVALSWFPTPSGIFLREVTRQSWGT